MLLSALSYVPNNTIVPLKLVSYITTTHIDELIPPKNQQQALFHLISDSELNLINETKREARGANAILNVHSSISNNDANEQSCYTLLISGEAVRLTPKATN